MRADRLLAILMLLQKNGRTTAQSLSRELEVSERTIYRDIDALSVSGIPVYAQRGPGGGISLLESYRTDLTGLTTAELQALMTLSVPAPLLDLGIGADLASALRKLAAAVPGSRRETSSLIQERFLIDSSEWSGTRFTGSLFETIRKALWDGWKLALSYYSEIGSHAGTISAVVRPLGLVAAAGDWHLVAGRGIHTIVIPLAGILSADITSEHFERPQDFQLESFWQDRSALKQRQRPSFLVTAYIKETALPLVGDLLQDVPQTSSADERRRVTLQFDTFERARILILSLGNAIDVIEPLSLRLSIEDYARQILSVYENV